MVRTNHPDLDFAIDRSFESVAANQSTEFLYFQETKAPGYLAQLESEVKQFLTFQQQNHRKLVVVTSGGTTVPLENNTVRFIDNFSAGTRGSISAEYFLKHGYAVIFLHREFSLRPFSQNFANESIMDLLEVDESTGEVKVIPKFDAKVKTELEVYKKVKSENLLLEIPFTTVNQYLYTLRMTGLLVQPFKCNAMFYLAAAVSDFFLPTSKISEHKIQSRGTGKLVIDLDPVPKFLNSLTKLWTPGAMIISFKLETDRSILLTKCRDALKKYGHQLVIGNLLQTRKDEVYLVTTSNEQRVALEGSSGTIEDKFLPYVLDMHNQYIQSSN